MSRGIQGNSMAFQGNSRELSVNSPGSGMRESPWNFREFPRIFQGNSGESQGIIREFGISGNHRNAGNSAEFTGEFQGNSREISGNSRNPLEMSLEIPGTSPDAGA